MKNRNPMALTPGIVLFTLTNLLNSTASAIDDFTWQGKLVDGGVAADGVYDLKFRLYDAAAGPAQVGSELAVDDVFIADGLLTIDLDFGAGAFPGADRWMEVDLKADADGAYTTLAPRQPMYAVPYAMHAHTVASAAVPFNYSGPDAVFTGGNVGIGTTSPSSPLHVRADASYALVLETASELGQDTGVAIAGARNGTTNSDVAFIDLINHDSNEGAGVTYPMARIAAGMQDVSGQNSFLRFFTSESGVLSERMRITKTGSVGIGVTAPANARLHVQESDSGTAYALQSHHSSGSGTTYGIYGKTDSTGGRGVFGHATATTGGTRGVYGEVHSQDGVGVQGFNAATTGPGHAGYFSSQSDSGIALYSTANSNANGLAIGIRGDSNTSQGIGVYGLALDTTGFNYGVYGQSPSLNGHGVRGEATASLGLTFGGWFTSASRTGAGIEATCLDSSDAYGGAGVKGFANNGLGVGVLGRAQHDTGDTKGIHGIVDSPNGHAGYFKGGRNYFEGFVGIGTEDPSDMLHLASLSSTIIRLEADTDNSIESHQPRIEMSQDDGIVTGSIGFHDSSNSMSLRTFDTGGGTPHIHLEAEGSTIVGSGNSHLGRFVVNQATDTSSGGIGILNSSGILSGRFWVASNSVVRLDSNGSGTGLLALNAGGGNVGIGTTLPAFQFHVNGTAAKPGGGSWTNSSDRRLKKNIEPLDGALDSLLALRGVTFEYKEPEKINELPGERIGVIAQEVEQVFPDWVDESGYGYKSVTFRGFEALAVEALRELRAEKDREIAARDIRIAAVEEYNRALLERLERLEAAMERMHHTSR